MAGAFKKIGLSPLEKKSVLNINDHIVAQEPEKE